MIPSPSPSMKIQIMGGKICFRCKGKTLLGIVNKNLKAKRLLTSPSNALPYYLKKTFPSIIWIFTEGEGDGIESRLSSFIFIKLQWVENESLLKQFLFIYKVEKIYEDSLDLIPSPSPSVKIQIIGWKVYLRYSSN